MDNCIYISRSSTDTIAFLDVNPFQYALFLSSRPSVSRFGNHAVCRPVISYSILVLSSLPRLVVTTAGKEAAYAVLQLLLSCQRL